MNHHLNLNQKIQQAEKERERVSGESKTISEREGNRLTAGGVTALTTDFRALTLVGVATTAAGAAT